MIHQPKNAAELVRLIVDSVHANRSMLITTDAAEQVAAIVNSVGRCHSFAVNSKPTMASFLSSVFDWMDDKKLGKLPFIGVIRKGQGYIGSQAPDGWRIVSVESVYISASSVLEVMINQKRDSLKK